MTENFSKSLHDHRKVLDENVQLEKTLNEKNSSITLINYELSEKEKDLEGFKQKILDLERQSNVKDQHSDSYEKQIMALKNRISVLESSVELLQDERDSLASKEKDLLRLLEKSNSRVSYSQEVIRPNSEHNLKRVQNSIDLIRNLSSKEVVSDGIPLNNVDEEQILTKKVEQFLKQTGEKAKEKNIIKHQSNTSNSDSSKEKLIEEHDLAYKHNNDPPLDTKQHNDKEKLVSRRNRALKSSNYTSKGDSNSRGTKMLRKRQKSKTKLKSSPTNVEKNSGLSSKFLHERLFTEQKWGHSSTGNGREGYPCQIKQKQTTKNGAQDYFHCCTLTHTIPSECTCVCVCLPNDYQLCCADQEIKYFVDSPLRFGAGQAAVMRSEFEPKKTTTGNILI